MIPTIILLAVLATSILSGVVGMVGGMILMALLAALLPVPLAMMLHGVTQAAANGSRAWFLRDRVRRGVLPPWLAGAGLCVLVFGLLTIVPDRALVLVLVGLFPWIGRLLPAIERLDVERPAHALACGAIVTGAQLLAGASGPLLDVFFLRSHLDRHEIVATKAVTQTLGHLLKLAYYGMLFGVPGGGGEAAAAAPPWLFAAVVPVALAGTRLGTACLDRLEEAQFRRASERIILAVGAACTMAGVIEFVRG